MRFTILMLASGLLLLQSCIKTKVYSVNSDMKSVFNYKPGSYWIYKDSITGVIDSVYVTANQDEMQDGGGCVIIAYAPKIKIEEIGISLFVSNGNPSDSEQWYFNMQQSQFNISFRNNMDFVESEMRFNLFSWPLAVSKTQSSSGCDPGLDSGAVTDIIPEVAVGGQSYTNAARSAHLISSGMSNNLYYNDCFFVNQEAGIIKIVFDHPSDSVHRVLELQRYHLVR